MAWSEQNLSILQVQHRVLYHNGKMASLNRGWVHSRINGYCCIISDEYRNEVAMGNIAYIDGQNLYMATTMASNPWHIDMHRFRVYLRQKYHVEEAYYFIGAFDDPKVDLYKSLQQAGFIVMWRMHGIKLKGNKKGNVDVDITFQMMRDLHERGDEYDKILLVSGDGDYYRVVEYFNALGKLEKVLLPNKQFASSLYKRLTREKWALVDTPDMRTIIGRNK